MADARVSQAALEALSAPAPAARVTQRVVEVLGTLVPVALPTATAVTQTAAELLHTVPVSAQVTQDAIELLWTEVPPGWRFYIDGIEKTPRVDSLNLVFILNERARASAVLGDVLPAKFAEVLSLAKDGFTRMFHGLIMTRGFAGRNQYDPTFTTTIECADDWIYTDSVYVTRTYNAPVLLKTVLQDLVTIYLSQYGIALDPAQADGPELAPFSWQAKRASDAIRELTERTSWVARLNAYQFLRLFIPGTDPAPFALTDAAPHCQELAWSDSDRGGGLPVNKVTVIAGPAGARMIGGEAGGAAGERHDGDGVTRVFPLYSPFLSVVGAVYIDSLHSAGGGFPLGICGVDIDPDTGGNMKYCYSAADNAVHQRDDQAVIAVGDFLALTYFGTFPFTVTAATGETPVVELVETRPEVLSIPAAQEIADSLLASFGAAGAETRELAIVTDEDGFEPGQALTVDLPVTRSIAGAFVITEVAMTIILDPDPPSREAYWQYTLKATEASAYQGSYLDDWRRLTGAGGSTAGGSAGSGGGSGSGLHAAHHQAGGIDAIPLDTLAAPSDTTLLDVSTARHGLAPKITGADGVVLTKAGAAAVWAPAEKASGVFAYTFNTTTTEPPGSQRIRFNAAHPYTAVTKVWADFASSQSEDLYWGWMRIRVGSILIVQDKDNHLQFAEFLTTGAPIDKGAYVELPVEWVSNGTALAVQGVLVRVTGPAPGGGGGSMVQAEYVVEAGHADLSAEAVLGTKVITTATEAARQAAAKGGRLFLPSDGYYLARDTGAAWADWGPLFPMTRPVSGAFAWVNQGTATIDASRGGVHLSAPGTLVGFNLVGRFLAVTPPYTITAYLLPAIVIKRWLAYGLFFRQSSDGKLAGVAVGAHASGADGVSPVSLRSIKATSPTVFSAEYLTVERSVARPPNWLRIVDDNTNRAIYFSADGQHWQLFHTIARTDFLTANEVGWGAVTQIATSPTAPVDLTLLSWAQT